MLFGVVNHWLGNCTRLFCPIDNIIIPTFILHVAKIIVICIALSLKLKRCMNLMGLLSWCVTYIFLALPLALHLYDETMNLICILHKLLYYCIAVCLSNDGIT